jgi:hypothetical protein
MSIGGGHNSASKRPATFRDRDARLALSHMAQVWLRLAERNDLMPPLATARAQPAFQQQQQVQPKQAQLGPVRKREKNP